MHIAMIMAMLMNMAMAMIVTMHMGDAAHQAKPFKEGTRHGKPKSSKTASRCYLEPRRLTTP